MVVFERQRSRTKMKRGRSGSKQKMNRPSLKSETQSTSCKVIERGPSTQSQQSANERNSSFVPSVFKSTLYHHAKYRYTTTYRIHSFHRMADQDINNDISALPVDKQMEQILRSRLDVQELVSPPLPKYGSSNAGSSFP